MSSLLDILHKTDRNAESGTAVPEPAGDSAAQTVELRLAVDNGPADTTVPDVSLTPQPETAKVPFETLAGPAIGYAAPPDATLMLTTRQLRGRSRRNTALLGAGLILIVVAAAGATWFLNQVHGPDAAGDSQFLGSPSASAAAAPITTRNSPAEPTVIANTRPAVTTTTPAPRPEAPATDTRWFDTPAVEEPPAAEPIRIVRGTTTNPLFPKLSAAWTAFQAGDYAHAETLYREVRATDANNVDALLGLGALAARGGRSDEARDLYQAVLRAEPRDATAISALSTLPASSARGLDESSLKTLLREQPGAATVHFALGLQYVTQGRWPDAQAAFFEAVRNEPTNADYVYNLAVSLDRVGQTQAAATYYQRALDLATGSVLFSPAAAKQRLASLRPAAP